MRVRRGLRGKGTVMYAVILGGAFIIIIVVLAITFGYFSLRDSSKKPQQQGPSSQSEREEVMYTSAIQMDPASDISTTIATVRNRKGVVLSPARLVKRQEYRQKMREQRQQATAANTTATTGATATTDATTGATATTQSILPNPIAGSVGACPDAQAVLAYHNAMRAAHFDTPPLNWSDTVADKAQTHANGKEYKHSNGSFGENIAIGPELTCEGAARLWYSEAAVMPWGNPGVPMFEAAGHATAMLWKATTEMGCGFSRIGDQNFVVCQYNPPGNMGGDGIVENYRTNVLPPK